MEIKGQIISIGQLQTGATKTGGTWQKQEIVIMQDTDYPKPACITFFGDKVEKIKGFFTGETITVSVNIESREYNGRWYTEVNGWRVEK